MQEIQREKVTRSIEKLKNQLENEAKIKFSSFVSGGVRNIRTLNKNKYSQIRSSEQNPYQNSTREIENMNSSSRLNTPNPWNKYMQRNRHYELSNLEVQNSKNIKSNNNF